MKDPVHIFGAGEPEEQKVEPLVTNKDVRLSDKERFERRVQMGFLIFGGIIVLALVSPLVIWLGRLAGGW